MHTGQDATGRVSVARAKSGGVLSPGKAFFLLLIPVVAAGLLALFFVGRDAPAPSTNARPAEGLALTDAEAIAKFEELNELRLQALRERDPSLLSLAFTPDSPIVGNVSKSIRRLTRTNVTVENRETTESLSVISNDTAEIKVRQVVVLDPRFFAESGEEVTVDPVLERQIIEWTIHRIDDRWLLHDGLIVEATPVKKDRGS
jgi:hypothetical protein